MLKYVVCHSERNPGCCVSGASMLHPVPHLHMLCGERDVLEEAMLSLREVRAETGAAC